MNNLQSFKFIMTPAYTGLPTSMAGPTAPKTDPARSSTTPSAPFYSKLSLQTNRFTHVFRFYETK
jgi:hypothetical protein